jgi:4'-phosphopantetheinyl transferase
VAPPLTPPAGVATADIGGRRLDTVHLLGSPVELWHARVVDADPAYREMLALLDSVELARLDGIGASEVRAQYATGRALTRLLLAGALGVDPRAVPIRLTESGRPYVDTPPGDDGAPSHDFNVSHSGDAVVVAIGHGVRVGVDLEAIAPRPGARRLALRYFSPAECDHVGVDGEVDLARWYGVWTRREAYTKACGMGVAAIAHGLDGRGERWESADVAALPGYALSVVALSVVAPRADAGPGHLPPAGTR